MKLLPLTPAQASFVEVEIIGRYEDDIDDTIASVVATVADHFARTSATGTPGLAVPNAELLRQLFMEQMNAIDDAIEGNRSEAEGYGNVQHARRLHVVASALYNKLKSHLGETDLTVANTIAEQIGAKAFLMLGASNKLGDHNSLTFKIGRNAQGVTHIRVQLDPDDTYTMQFLRVGRAPRFERKVLSEAKGLYAEDLRRSIEKSTGMYTSL